MSYYGRKITFDEFFTKIEETSKALKTIGVKENDIVTISMPNTPEAAYLFYAMSKIGAVANMVDPRTSAEGLKKYIKEGSELVEQDESNVKGIQLVQRNLSYIKDERIRHNPDAVAAAIIEIICEDLKFKDKQNDPKYVMMNAKLKYEKKMKIQI